MAAAPARSSKDAPQPSSSGGGSRIPSQSLTTVVRDVPELLRRYPQLHVGQDLCKAVFTWLQVCVAKVESDVCVQRGSTRNSMVEC